MVSPSRLLPWLRFPVVVHLLLLLVLLVRSPLPRVSASSDAFDDDSEEDSGGGEDYSLLTYGSAIRFRHASSSYHLHSHGISYGSGSGQQSVTAVSAEDDSGSLWQVKEAYHSPVRPLGTPVRCGDVIRLQHVTTRKYLHSHLHTSPLTNRQEVSGYGEASHSDTGDNWKVDCTAPAMTVGAVIPLPPSTPSSSSPPSSPTLSLHHVDTGKRLYSRRVDEFTQQNCRGCPIIGQLEISAAAVNPSDSHAQWSIPHSGILFPTITQQQ